MLVHLDDNDGMAEGDKRKSKANAEKKAPKVLRVPAKIVEPPGNLRKREKWFRQRSGS